jgi:hypothetical protein
MPMSGKGWKDGWSHVAARGRRMDEWVGGWRNGWIDGRTDRWMEVKRGGKLERSYGVSSGALNHCQLTVRGYPWVGHLKI